MIPKQKILEKKAGTEKKVMLWLPLAVGGAGGRGGGDAPPTSILHPIELLWVIISGVARTRPGRPPARKAAAQLVTGGWTRSSLIYGLLN